MLLNTKPQSTQEGKFSIVVDIDLIFVVHSEHVLHNCSIQIENIFSNIFPSDISRQSATSNPFPAKFISDAIWNQSLGIVAYLGLHSECFYSLFEASSVGFFGFSFDSWLVPLIGFDFVSDNWNLERNFIWNQNPMFMEKINNNDK